MLIALLRRLAQMGFVMAGISILVFLIFFATPGADPAARLAGRNATPQVLAAVRHDFGFDRPFPIQYALMMKRLFVTRDLTSFVNRGERVIPEIIEATPVTLSLVLGAALLWVVCGMAIGTAAALTRGSILDRGLMLAGLVGVSMPVFWVAEVANLVTQSRLHDSWAFSWVPPLGYKQFGEDPAGWFKTLIIPWITLALLYIGLYGRVLRASLLEGVPGGVHPHGAGEGAGRDPHSAPSRAAHLADSLRLPIRPRFRCARGRRRPADGSRLRPARCRQAHLRRAAEPGPPGHHGDRHVRLVLRRCGERGGRCGLSAARPAGEAPPWLTRLSSI